MTAIGWIQIFLFCAVIAALTKPLGWYMTRVFEGERTPLSPLLRPIGGDKPQSRQGATIALALAISASHGLLVLSPVPIAVSTFLTKVRMRLSRLRLTAVRRTV